MSLFIKRLLFIIIFSCIYCFIGFKLFSSIIYANSVIIPYGIHHFDICIKNPDLWRYIEITFIFTYIFSSLIISNSIYRILCTIFKKIYEIIRKFCKIRKISIFSRLINIFNKLIYFILQKKQIMKTKYTFFSSRELSKNNLLKHDKLLKSKKPLQLFVGNTISSNNPIYLPATSLYQNILVTGTIGTGKTSSAMYPFTKQLIQYCNNNSQNKIGMLILDVKGNYYIKVSEFAKQFNRENDLIVISLGGKYKYNPLHKPNLKSTVLANRLKSK